MVEGTPPPVKIGWLVHAFNQVTVGLFDFFFLKNRTLAGFDVAGTERENTNDDNQLLKGVKSNIFIIELHGEFWCA